MVSGALNLLLRCIVLELKVGEFDMQRDLLTVSFALITLNFDIGFDTSYL